MFISELIRNKGFEWLGRIKSNRQEAYIKDLRLFEEAGKPFAPIKTHLDCLLSTVTREVRFYKSYQGSDTLSAFPVINKSLIKSAAIEFRAPESLYAKTVKINTSGSYGTPIDYYLNANKMSRRTAEVLFFGEKTGYYVGRKHGVFMSNAKKSKLKLWLQNEVFFAAKDLDEAFLKRSRLRLLKGDIPILIGFPSAIARVAQYCIDQGDKPNDFKIEGVITCSENLDSLKRQVIEKAFHCKVHNRYSTEELGVLAYQESEDSGFNINNYHYIVEILDLHKNTPVNVGEVGRVVVTDLFNYAMPLIRYETGDLAVLKETYTEQSSWAKSFSKFSGRSIQIIHHTDGHALYPLYLDSIMERYPDFNQYQFIQLSSRDYELRLVLNVNSALSNELKESLLNDFKTWLGTEALIEIKLVTDIEKLPSGKRPYIINKHIQ